MKRKLKQTAIILLLISSLSACTDIIYLTIVNNDPKEIIITEKTLDWDFLIPVLILLFLVTIYYIVKLCRAKKEK